MLISHLRVVLNKDTVTGVRLVAVGKQKKGLAGLVRHQAEVAVDGSDWAERRMWNAGQRDNMNSFLKLAYLGPFYAKETARICQNMHTALTFWNLLTSRDVPS